MRSTKRGNRDNFFLASFIYWRFPPRVCSRTLRTPFVHYLSDRPLCRGGFTDETKTIYLGKEHNVICGAFSAFTVKSHNFFFSTISPVCTPVDCVSLCIIGSLSTAWLAVVEKLNKAGGMFPMGTQSWNRNYAGVETPLERRAFRSLKNQKKRPSHISVHWETSILHIVSDAVMR